MENFPTQTKYYKFKFIGSLCFSGKKKWRKNVPTSLHFLSKIHIPSVITLSSQPKMNRKKMIREMKSENSKFSKSILPTNH